MDSILFNIILTILIVCIVIFIFRGVITNRKVKRIAYYSLSPLNNDSLSIGDKIIDKYFDFIKTMRKNFQNNVNFKKESKKYEKYIKYTSKDKIKAIDFVINKFVLALVFLVVTMILQCFNFSIFNLFKCILSFIIGYYILDLGLLIYKYRQNKLVSNELLRAIIIMNNAFKSGKSILQAVQIASEELPEPICDEFKKMYLDMKFGLSVDTVFDRFAKRVNLEETVYVASSLKIFNRTGGNIVEVFSSIERALFDKKKLNEELKNIAASPILTIVILIIIPIAFTFLIYILNPNYFLPLTQSLLGYIIIGMILLMFIIYVLLLIKVLKIEV